MVFEFWKLVRFFFVSMSDLVHDVDAIHGLCLLLASSGKLFYAVSY